LKTSCMSSGRDNPRVVLDTNVYISALLFGGIPAEIIELGREKKIQILSSSSILLELAKILQDKFSFQRRMIFNVIAEIKRFSEIIYPKQKLNVIGKDKADNKILECALEGKSKYIISGDSHILELKEFRGIKILSPSEFIKTF